jgi:uncharacterized protein (TIGR04255 family)
MRFKEFERVEYQHNLLFNVVFQARFPDIMKISQEMPVEFQDIVRKQGYPESSSNVPVLPSGIPNELKELISTDKSFDFFSAEKDWQVSLTKNFIALACTGKYKNYKDFRERLEKVLEIFSEIYEPSYFTRIGLRYQNIANSIFLPHMKQGVETFIPHHVFPELATPIITDIEALERKSQFNDGTVKATVVHVLSRVSGKFGQKQLINEKSYIIDIDCFSESKTEGINDALTRCDIFKRLNWNIFQWSITDNLRDAMGRPKS